MNGANSRKDRNKILNLENMNLGEGKEIGPSDILRRISQLSPRRKHNFLLRMKQILPRSPDKLEINLRAFFTKNNLVFLSDNNMLHSLLKKYGSLNLEGQTGEIGTIIYIRILYHIKMLISKEKEINKIIIKIINNTDDKILLVNELLEKEEERQVIEKEEEKEN